MKKIIFLLIVIFFSVSILEAQNRSRKRGSESLTAGKQLMQVSGGYNLSFINPQGLNYALEQANQGSFGSQQFTKFGLMQGYSAALTWYGKYEDCKHRRMTSYLF
ncbi:MAG: hypothetical protein EAZ85_06815 [Bacteroidetes bacterium]|nr:MAG: hypothetical protein EAZ85_06815 [Bacteroidota bacterium]TAG89531.1 MAG: hypothetical protein EAZ20_06220 [Bacteroidota bacterium]